MSVNGEKGEQLIKSTLKLNASKTLSSNEQLSYSLCNILACSMVLFNGARDFEITIVRYAILAFHIDFLFIALQKRDKKKDTHSQFACVGRLPKKLIECMLCNRKLKRKNRATDSPVNIFCSILS